MTVTGWAGDVSELLYRDGVREGDLVGCSGRLGGRGAGLLLLHGTQASLPERQRDELIRRHRRPEPRLSLGRALAGARASAAIDLSDGVATDVGHLASRSGVAIDVRLADLPLAPGEEAVARAAGEDRRSWRPRPARTSSCSSRLRPSAGRRSRKRAPRQERRSPGSAKSAPGLAYAYFERTELRLT